VLGSYAHNELIYRHIYSDGNARACVNTRFIFPLIAVRIVSIPKKFSLFPTITFPSIRITAFSARRRYRYVILLCILQRYTERRIILYDKSSGVGGQVARMRLTARAADGNAAARRRHCLEKKTAN